MVSMHCFGFCGAKESALSGDFYAVCRRTFLSGMEQHEETGAIDSGVSVCFALVLLGRMYFLSFFQPAYPRISVYWHV